MSEGPVQAVTLYQQPTIDVMIEAWLHAKRGRSDSVQTERRYRHEMAAFRALLASQSLDLDANPVLLATIAQGWAARGAAAGERRVGGASFNMRLGILSSFYRYVLRMGFGGFEQNPIERVERAPVAPYADVRALAYRDVKRRLSEIDTNDLTGQRDKALLMLALTTGRRLSEVASMRREHLSYEGIVITVTFPRAKGGKVMRDELTRAMSVMLSDYLRAIDASGMSHDPQAIWVGFGPRNRGHAIGARAIENICRQRLGTEHFHALRHTFAHAMEEAGAKVSEIQARLGHSSLATTGRYLAQLASEKNPYAGIIETYFTDE